jgi:hypothetical protein
MKPMKSLTRLVKGYTDLIPCSQLPMLYCLRKLSYLEKSELTFRPRKEALARVSLSMSTTRSSKEPLLPSTLSQILRRQGISSLR